MQLKNIFVGLGLLTALNSSWAQVIVVPPPRLMPPRVVYTAPPAVVTPAPTIVAPAPVVVAPAPRPYRIEIRQLNWKAQLFANPAQAAAFAQSKTSRGYEVLQQPSPGPLQVSYRMPQWHMHAVVPNGGEAHAIARSLQTRGYEVKVVH